MTPFSVSESAAPANRPSWSGLLQLSLVGIPIQAFPAVRCREVSHFHQLHGDCGQRIRYAKHCPVHGTVAAAQIVKGYEYGPGQHLVIDPEDLEPLRPAPDRALRLERFVEPAQVDLQLLSGRSLHLLPDGPAAEHAYDVVRQGMQQRGRWAVGRVVLGGQRQVVCVRPVGGILLMHVLHFPENVRACPRRVADRPVAAGAELSLAQQLIDAASGAFDGSGYKDESAEELRVLVERKLQGQVAAEPAPSVLPFLQALQQSVAAVQPIAPPSPTTVAPATVPPPPAKPRPSRKRKARSA